MYRAGEETSTSYNAQRRQKGFLHIDRLFGALEYMWTADTDGANYAYVARYNRDTFLLRELTGLGTVNNVRGVRSVRE